MSWIKTLKTIAKICYVLPELRLFINRKNDKHTISYKSETLTDDCLHFTKCFSRRYLSNIRDDIKYKKERDLRFYSKERINLNDFTDCEKRFERFE